MFKPARLPESWVLHISKIAVASFLVLGSLQALTILLQQVRPEGGLTSDLVQYWTTGKLLRAHANPYDLSRTYQVEHLEGVDKDSVRINIGPPVVLPLWLPLGYMTARTARLAWFWRSSFACWRQRVYWAPCMATILDSSRGWCSFLLPYFSASARASWEFSCCSRCCFF